MSPPVALAVDDPADLAPVLRETLRALADRLCAPQPMAALLAPGSTEDIVSLVEITLPDGRVLTGLVALGFEVGGNEALAELQEFRLS
jgi:ABC-type thiamine transport system ATPase subunit